MLNRNRKQKCLNTTADILHSLKEGCDSGSMIFCMAAFVSVLLLQKELEEDVSSASPAARYSIFAALCLSVLGFAIHAFVKARNERAEEINKAEEKQQLLLRIETLEAQISSLTVKVTAHHNKPTVILHEDGAPRPSTTDSLTTPLLLKR